MTKKVYPQKGEELSKRFYVSGVGEITMPCPNCKAAEAEYDFDQQCLSYPLVGKAESLNWYCNNCDHEWQQGTVQVDVNVTIDLEG